MVWPRCVGLASARGGAVAALQAYYAVPDLEPFTQSVDLAQTEVATLPSQCTASSEPLSIVYDCSICFYLVRDAALR